MRWFQRSLITLIACMMAPLASAGNSPTAITFSLMDGSYLFANKRNISNTSIPSFALAYDFTQHWAIEGEVGVLNSRQQSPLPKIGVHGALYMLDGLYRFAPYHLLEPYVGAGLGVISLQPNGNDSNHQGNANLALGAQLFIDRIIAFRAEARDLYTFSGGKNDVMLTAGLSFLWS